MTDSLQDIIDEMRSRKINHGKNLSPTLLAWADRLSALAAPVVSDADRRDAERYRRLREMFAFSEWSGDVKVHCDFDMPFGPDIEALRNNLDASIDALSPGRSGEVDRG